MLHAGHGAHAMAQRDELTFSPHRLKGRSVRDADAREFAVNVGVAQLVMPHRGGVAEWRPGGKRRIAMPAHLLKPTEDRAGMAGVDEHVGVGRNPRLGVAVGVVVQER